MFHVEQCRCETYLVKVNGKVYIMYEGKTFTCREENAYSLEIFCGSMLVDLHVYCQLTRP